MSVFQAADEAIASLWDGLARELDDLAPSSDAAHAFIEVACHQFLGMLRDFPHDVLTSVTAPHLGQENTVWSLASAAPSRGTLHLPQSASTVRQANCGRCCAAICPDALPNGSP
jgi:hypothetical protein